MPLWKIYHPVGAFTAEDKRALSQRINALYRGLPKFYAIVVFQEVAPESFYMDGEEAHNFVRIWVDHIARSFPPDAKDLKAKWMGWTEKSAGALHQGSRQGLANPHRRNAFRSLADPRHAPAASTFRGREALARGKRAGALPCSTACLEPFDSQRHRSG